MWLHATRTTKTLNDFEPAKIKPTWYRDRVELHRLMAFVFLLGLTGLGFVLVLAWPLIVKFNGESH